MKNVKKFDQFLNEMESLGMEAALESPEASGPTMSIEDYQDQKETSSVSSVSSDIDAYRKALQAVAKKYVGKKFGTPKKWGAVANPHWIIESFADISNASRLSQGAGIMLRAKRAEGQGQGGDWNVTVFISINVTKDPARAKLDIQFAFPSGTKTQDIPAPVMSKGGYYGAVDVMKRYGMNDMDVNARDGFTTAELEKYDPAWKPLFQDIEAVANIYGTKE